MLKFSKILLFFYVVLFIIYIVNQFLTSLILLLFVITFVSLLINLFNLVSTLKIKEKRNANILTSLTLFLPLIGIFSIRTYEIQRVKILSAYSELVITSADIIFYENNKMKYCNSSFIGEKCYNGTYRLTYDTFYVSYNGELPSIKSTKLTRLDNKLLFLGRDNSIVYEFNIDSKYLLEEVNLLK